MSYAQRLVPRSLAEAAPGLAMPRRYPRAYLRSDLVAGVTVGAVAAPSSLAMAEPGRVRRKMAEAVDLAQLHGHDPVDDALRIAADAGRFDEGALAAILAHQQTQSGQLIAFPAREASSLQRSTRAWEGFRA